MIELTFTPFEIVRHALYFYLGVSWMTGIHWCRHNIQEMGIGVLSGALHLFLIFLAPIWVPVYWLGLLLFVGIKREKRVKSSSDFAIAHNINVRFK